jgi:hypothetical protein
MSRFSPGTNLRPAPDYLLLLILDLPLGQVRPQAHAHQASVPLPLDDPRINFRLVDKCTRLILTVFPSAPRGSVIPANKDHALGE